MTRGGRGRSHDVILVCCVVAVVPYGNRGCSGGSRLSTVMYMVDNGGVDTSKSYPYIGRVSPALLHASTAARAFQTFEYWTRLGSAILSLVERERLSYFSTYRVYNTIMMFLDCPRFVGN